MLSFRRMRRMIFCWLWLFLILALVLPAVLPHS